MVNLKLNGAPTHLLRDTLDNRLFEFPAEDRAVRLHRDAVVRAVRDDILLLAQRVQLGSEGRSVVSAYRRDSHVDTHLDLVYRRLFVPCCGQLFQMRDSADQEA